MAREVNVCGTIIVKPKAERAKEHGSSIAGACNQRATLFRTHRVAHPTPHPPLVVTSCMCTSQRRRRLRKQERELQGLQPRRSGRGCNTFGTMRTLRWVHQRDGRQIQQVGNGNGLGHGRCYLHQRCMLSTLSVLVVKCRIRSASCTYRYSSK